jgi:hypothetical protein
MIVNAKSQMVVLPNAVYVLYVPVLLIHSCTNDPDILWRTSMIVNAMVTLSLELMGR